MSSAKKLAVKYAGRGQESQNTGIYFPAGKKMRNISIIMASLVLAACGVGETASVTATAAALKAKEAKQAKDTVDNVSKQVGENLQQGTQRLQAAEDKN